MADPVADPGTREWLIRKNGYFYRPNRSGYTMEKVAAGRYTKAEADREAAIEPDNFTVLHESEVPDAAQVVDLRADLAAERERNARLVAAGSAAYRTCMSAWASGEPAHRVKDMLDAVERLGVELGEPGATTIRALAQESKT